MLKLIDWAGMKNAAYAYTPDATEKQLAQYRQELELDRERRNRGIDSRGISPLGERLVFRLPESRR